jgi:hypothetical protein
MRPTYTTKHHKVHEYIHILHDQVGALLLSVERALSLCLPASERVHSTVHCARGRAIRQIARVLYYWYCLH